ncbi:MAG TPA: hypothetical protein DCG53_00930 [Syntrophus sp. (in: bacteria)]|nr:hypothetical protein [Syntrophus sp. (in: bacteria)]
MTVFIRTNNILPYFIDTNRLSVYSGRQLRSNFTHNQTVRFKVRTMDRKTSRPIIIVINCLILLVLCLPGAVLAGEIARDGRFIAYDNGTVLDTKTNLMWAAKDNGSDINWANAKSYCENYSGGGYTDWRMPTKDELSGLYDANKSLPSACEPNAIIHVITDLLDLTGYWVWAFATGLSGNAGYGFNNGTQAWDPHYLGSCTRVLPVRFAK